jgi:putative transposase
MAECGRGDDQIAAGWGKKTGKNPTDRGKLGVKRSVLVDGRGVPLAAVDGANVHDQKLLAPTLDSIPVSRPEPAPYQPQRLCLDKRYVGEPMEQEMRKRGYIPHAP